MTDPVVTSLNSVKSTAAAEVTKAESWLKKYLTVPKAPQKFLLFRHVDGEIRVV